jgi:ribosomal-protein-alanine N-acetyltransferase
MAQREVVRTHCRWMIRRDMAEVLAIERLSFAHPWTEADFLRALRQRNCIGMVAEQGETVVGFMVYELRKHRLVLLNLAVHPDWRRQGVGRVLAVKLASKLMPAKRVRLETHVRETNLPAQLFLKACGLDAVAVLRRWYDDTGEDAFHFRLQCPGTTGDRPAVAARGEEDDDD